MTTTAIAFDQGPRPLSAPETMVGDAGRISRTRTGQYNKDGWQLQWLVEGITAASWNSSGKFTGRTRSCWNSNRSNPLGSK